MKKTLLIIIILPILLTGCWDSTEPGELGVISVIGVDTLANDNFRVYLQEPNPKAQGQQSTQGGVGGSSAQSSPYFVHQGDGTSIYEAIQSTYYKNSRRLSFSHMNAIILSEELVRDKGIKPIIDFFKRNNRVRRDPWLIIAPKGQLQRIMSINAEKLNKDTGTIINNIIRLGNKDAFISALILNDFIKISESFGSEAYTSGIALTKNEQRTDTNEVQTGDLHPAGFTLSLSNTAIFKGTYLVGWLNRDESKGLLWVVDKLTRGAFNVNLKNDKISLKIINANSKIIPKILNGKMIVNIKVKVSSNIEESQANIDFRNIKVIEDIEQLQCLKVKEDISRSIEKTKEMGADVFGFGKRFYEKYPKYVKKLKDDWENYYKDLEVNIFVDSKINQIGANGSPWRKE